MTLTFSDIFFLPSCYIFFRYLSTDIFPLDAPDGVFILRDLWLKFKSSITVCRVKQERRGQEVRLYSTVPRGSSDSAGSVCLYLCWRRTAYILCSGTAKETKDNSENFQRSTQLCNTNLCTSLLKNIAMTISTTFVQAPCWKESHPLKCPWTSWTLNEEWELLL